MTPFLSGPLSRAACHTHAAASIAIRGASAATRSGRPTRACGAWRPGEQTGTDGAAGDEPTPYDERRLATFQQFVGITITCCARSEVAAAEVASAGVAPNEV